VILFIRKKINEKIKSVHPKKNLQNFYTWCDTIMAWPVSAQKKTLKESQEE
jgi:hypothetical protein